MAAIIPPAPRLSSDSMLEVFVHRSVSAYGPRFRILGEPFLKLAYTKALMEKRPTLGGHQLENYIDINYPTFVEHWVNAYGWRNNIMGVPHGVDFADPASGETRAVFEIYAGAVVKDYPQPGDPRGDPGVLFTWIRELVYISD